MKQIRTHLNPDLDAIASCWLLKRFLPGWEEAEIGYVPAKNYAEAKQIDGQILYVDVGNGPLDHHDTGQYLSATLLTWEFIKKTRKQAEFKPLVFEALGQLVEVITEIDNARELSWPEVTLPRSSMYLHNLLGGLRGLAESDEDVTDFGFKALEAVLLNLKSELKAKQELTEGQVFDSPWGKAIGVETGNDRILWTGEVAGYVLVVKKDPVNGSVRMYGRYDSQVDLSLVYQKIKELDPESDWFLHASKKLLLNKTAVNPGLRPTKLSLSQIMAIIKKGDHAE